MLRKKIIFFFLFSFVLSVSFISAKDFSFSTLDLDGNKVTDKIFSQKDVTVINIWGTFCGPCLREMPELGQWHKELPKNVQLIGIISDLQDLDDEDSINAVKGFMDYCGAGFTNIISNPSMYRFLSQFQYVPTTLLFDKNGNRIGEPIIGAQVNEYKKAVEAYLGKKK